MTGWLFHLAVGAAGLGAAGGVLRLAAVLGRNDPAALYRLGVTTLVVTLGLSAVQAAVGAARWLWAGPVVRELREERYVFLRPVPPGFAPTRTVRYRGHVADRLPPLAAPERPARTGLLALYAVGVGAVGLYHGLRLCRTAQFLRDCRPLADAGALAVWRRVAGGSPLRDRVRLLSHPGLAAPCCWGLGRPRLVVPEGRYAADDLEWALRHELTHLERRDAWVAVLQAVLTTTFWFHPVAWWLSRRLDEWCELSCDQLVVARTGARKRYALALVGFAARVRPAALRAGLLHGSDSHLRRRIEMLAVDVRPGRGLRRALTAVLALTWSAQLALAASPPAGLGRDRSDVRVLDIELKLRPPDRAAEPDRPASP
jgi:hypothetical protein